MKNAIYILALLLSTSFILSAQITEPLTSNNSEHIDNGYDHRRGTDYNHRNGNYNDGRNGNYNDGHSGNYNDGRNGNYNNSRYGNDGRRTNNGRYGNNNGRHGGYGHGGHGHGHNGGYGHGHNGHHAGHGGHGHHVGNRHGHRYVGYCNYTNHNYGWTPVSVSIFTGCRQRIRRCSFESDRLREAMIFVDRYHVSAHQIADMMRYFDFESTKLEFAKYAFHRTCDIQNYGIVFNEFAFNSSRRELDCYIRDYVW
jgi:hypothetical protein